MSTLNRAIAIAREAHAGQLDKGGHPVIDHVMRVVDALDGEDAKIVAALHDVLEDGAQAIRDSVMIGAPEAVLIDLLMLRRAEGLSYREYIKDIVEYGSNVARTVKIADLRDHLAPERVGVLSPPHIRRYERALEVLGATPSVPAAVPPSLRSSNAPGFP